jgi:mono/diheme cytochrome c family protein
MKLILAIALVTPFVAMVRQPITASPQAAASASDGLYTEEQSARGRKLYAQHCSACHGHDLAGGSSGGDVAPPLTGREFVAGWDGQTAGDLFERIRTSMPLDSPGSLSGQANADILAYVLASNKLPAGRTELTTDAATLKTIKLGLGKSIR